MSMNQEAGNSAWRITVGTMPKTLEELRVFPGADLTDYRYTAALAVAVLATYPRDKESCFAMLDYLKGPQPLSTYEKQFIDDRLRGKEYLPFSFFEGATPQNAYAPTTPLSIIVTETPHSRNQIGEGYIQVFLQSGGADAPRPVKLRNKPSTGQWFLWEQMLLSDIRIPEAADPWA